jgi:hypothetical protein
LKKDGIFENLVFDPGGSFNLKSLMQAEEQVAIFSTRWSKEGDLERMKFISWNAEGSCNFRFGTESFVFRGFWLADGLLRVEPGGDFFNNSRE